jgi:hypothetical protein
VSSLGIGQPSSRAHGNWLIAQALAELALTDAAFDPERLQEILRAPIEPFAGSGAGHEPMAQGAPAWLGVLAAAEPVLPLPLLRGASERLRAGSIT